jgi:hypothetical protein
MPVGDVENHRCPSPSAESLLAEVLSGDVPQQIPVGNEYIAGFDSPNLVGRFIEGRPNFQCSPGDIGRDIAGEDMVCPYRASVHVECTSDDRTPIFKSRDVAHLKSGAEPGAGRPKHRVATVPVPGAAVSADNAGAGGLDIISAPGKHLAPMHCIVISVDSSHQAVPLGTGRDTSLFDCHFRSLLFVLLLKLYAGLWKTILDCPFDSPESLLAKPLLVEVFPGKQRIS